MAGRYHASRRAEDYRGSITSRESLEEELREQHREVESIFSENRMIIEDNTLLHRELSAMKGEIEKLDKIIPTLRAERKARERDLITRKTMLEADLRASEALKTKVVELRDEVPKLNSASQELYLQIQGLTNIVNRFKAENQNVVSMRTDIDRLKKEVVEARKDCEYEKKAAEEQAELKQAVEKNVEFMAREIEDLRAEQLNTGFGRYERSNGSPEMRYLGGGGFGDGYASSRRHYEKRSTTRRERMY